MSSTRQIPEQMQCLLLLVGLDLLAGLQHQRAVGLHVQHLGGDAGDERSRPVDRRLALEVRESR